MSDPIETFLNRNGPSVSSEVAAHLVEHHGMSAVAARKRVQRAGGEIRRLQGISFPHKARFIYLQKHFGAPWYWDRLATALIQTRSAYGFALAALRQRNGIVATNQFPVVCGAPLRQSKQLSPETILSRLIQAGLVAKVDMPGIGDCVALVQADGYDGWIGERMRARKITEDVLLLAVKDWLKNLGFVSYGKVAVRTVDITPKVGTFVWDLSAPSYLGHMVRSGKDGKLKNGFVACDVHMGDTMTAAGVAPFIRKCVTLRSLRNVGSCMQILVADRYEGPAFRLLKENGIIPATPANLFGEDVAEGLRQLTSVLENASHSIINSDRFDELFSRLGKIEGASVQLRGTLFEYLAAELARKTISPDVRMNRLFKVPGQGQAEGDVVAVTANTSITVIECKGYSPRATIPEDLFRRWLQYNIPLCYREIKEHPDWRNLDATFEFWATAPLSDDSMALFAKAQAALNPDRYAIALRLGPDLHAACRATKDPNLITAFEKHFMKVERGIDNF